MGISNLFAIKKDIVRFIYFKAKEMDVYSTCVIFVSTIKERLVHILAKKL